MTTLKKPVKTESYYGHTMMLSESKRLVSCLVQKGTGVTEKTCNLVEMWFPYHLLKPIITAPIIEGGYTKQHYFKVLIKTSYRRAGLRHSRKVTKYKFTPKKETKKLKEWLTGPDIFKDMDVSFLKGE